MPPVAKPKAVPIVKLKAANVGTSTLEIANLWLEGDKGVRAFLNRSLTDAVHEQTLDGASTVTIPVRDPDRRLLRSELVKTRATLTLDGVQYRLVKVSHDGNQLTLIFEATAVNILREYNDPRKANRNTMTRAQFVRSLVLEPKGYVIPFRCPEVSIAQPIATA